LAVTPLGVGCGGDDDGSKRAVEWAAERAIGPKSIRLVAKVGVCLEPVQLEQPIVEYEGHRVYIEFRHTPEDDKGLCLGKLLLLHKTVTFKQDTDELVLFDASTDPPEQRWPRKPTRALERPLQSSPTGDLWSRNFIATSVSGRPGKLDPPVQQPPQIRLSFSGKRHHGVGWKARCNGFGGKVRFDEAKLKVEQVLSRTVGCGEEREREDEWLLQFMNSKPEWQLEGTRLTLVSENAEIEFTAEDADPDSFRRP